MAKRIAQLEAKLAATNTKVANYRSSLSNLENKLTTVQSNLGAFEGTGEAGYFKQTGAQKLATKEVPSYADVYNKEYSAIKDVQFTLGGDAATTSNTDNAFYVFNAARTAEQKTEQQIGAVEKNNLAYQKQQEDIATFLNNEKQAAQSAVLQTYLSTVLNPAVSKGEIDPFKYDQVDRNTASGLARWNAAKKSNQSTELVYDPVTKKHNTVYSVKLSEEESAAKRQLAKEIETTRFMSSSNLQETYTELYAKQLETSIANTRKQQRNATNKVDKLERQQTKIANKLERQQTKAANKLERQQKKK
jgi:hypothetical protein